MHSKIVVKGQMNHRFKMSQLSNGASESVKNQSIKEPSVEKKAKPFVKESKVFVSGSMTIHAVENSVR